MVKRNLIKASVSNIRMQIIKQTIQPYFFLFSLLFIMALYLPVNYFSFVNMDDIGLIQRLHNNYLNVNFLDLFFRNAAPKYYRPGLEMINYLDYSVWGISMAGYHFTNYLLHVLNACLVYLIALQLFKTDKNSNVYASMSMLFFALNPLACESVAWISGRSDLAGTFFSLLAVNCYFFKNPLRFVLTPIFILSGLFCKENALAVIPILVLVECFNNYMDKKTIIKNIKACFIWCVILMVPLFLYLFLRTNGWEYFTYKYIEAAPLVTTGNKVQYKIDIVKILYVFPVIAFYFKKLIMPFPLNFAISQINILFYSFLFVAFFCINIIWCFKRKIPHVFFSILLLFSFAPALPVALGGVSWVPLAERYLYLSLTIFSIAMVFLVRSFYENGIIGRKWLLIFCGAISLVFFVSTLSREFVWKNSESLWADTLRKSPDSSMVLFKYGQTFGGEKAQWAYKKALANSYDFKWKADTLMEMAVYERSIGKYEKAIEIFKQALAVKSTFDNYCEVAANILGMTADNVQQEQGYIKKAIGYYKLAYMKKKTPFVLYKIGILLKKTDKIDQANELFMEVVKKYPDSMYAVYAKQQFESNRSSGL